MCKSGVGCSSQIIPLWRKPRLLLHTIFFLTLIPFSFTFLFKNFFSIRMLLVEWTSILGLLKCNPNIKIHKSFKSKLVFPTKIKELSSFKLIVSPAKLQNFHHFLYAKPFSFTLSKSCVCNSLHKLVTSVPALTQSCSAHPAVSVPAAWHWQGSCQSWRVHELVFTLDTPVLTSVQLLKNCHVLVRIWWKRNLTAIIHFMLSEFINC